MAIEPLTESQRKLASDYFPWMRKVIRPYLRKYWKSYDEIQYAGEMGLMTAAAKWDQSRGIRFATYCALCIKTQIAHFKRSMQTSRSTLSIHLPQDMRHPVDSFHADKTIAELLCGTDDPIDADIVFHEEINKLFGTLSSRHRDVMISSYLQGKTYEEIAMQMGVSKQRIGQMMRSSLQLLREKMGIQLDGPTIDRASACSGS